MQSMWYQALIWFFSNSFYFLTGNLVIMSAYHRKMQACLRRPQVGIRQDAIAKGQCV
jgi:hypothetical protein